MPALSQVGFDGWWNTMEKCFGACLSVIGRSSWVIQHTGMGHLMGGWVLLWGIQCAVISKLRGSFSSITSLCPILGEIKCVPMNSEHVFPCVPLVLLLRVEDNLYLICLYIPHDLMPIVRAGITEFLQLVYGLRLKWEKHGGMVTWGEGKLGAAPNGAVIPLRKLCTLSLDVPVGQYEWGTWVDRCSPHYRLVWRSQFR